MKIRPCRVGMNETVEFASDELRRYLYKIDETVDVEPFYYDTYNPEHKNALWLIADPALAPEVKDPSMDDAFRISIHNNAGMIAGTNPVSVLIGVYSLLKKLGCKWIRPGRDGEIIEKKQLPPLNFEYEEKAAYRFRGIDFAVSSSTQTAIDMIDWLPKEGMNNYFYETLSPHFEFKMFSDYRGLADADYKAAFRAVAREAKRRGIKRHGVGHGWHMEAIGFHNHTSAWNLTDADLTEEQHSKLALRNGKRNLYLGRNLFGTQLCYSQNALRESIIEQIVNYLKENPEVDYLHFWLADGCNNHCECAECQKHRPSDWYVMMLNAIDRRLTEEGIKSRIACTIYVDLLWEPVEYSVENPDRFILDFAPITRTYDTSYSDFDKPAVKTPYVRNKLIWPSSAAENVAYLRDWQKKQLKGDSFLFDYHLMWNQYKDPGYRNLSRVIYEDMRNLRNLGLGGNISCEVFTCQIPNDFPHRIMARTLWNRDVDYDTEEKQCFLETYGVGADAAFAYLSKISDAFSLIYRYYNDPENTREEQECFAAKVEKIVLEFRPELEKYLSAELTRAQHISWELLDAHTEYIMEYARAYGAKYLNRTEEADRHLHAFNSVCEKIYGKYGKYFSAYQSQFSVKQHYEEITKNGPKVLIQ